MVVIDFSSEFCEKRTWNRLIHEFQFSSSFEVTYESSSARGILDMLEVDGSGLLGYGVHVWTNKTIAAVPCEVQLVSTFDVGQVNGAMQCTLQTEEGPKDDQNAPLFIQPNASAASFAAALTTLPGVGRAHVSRAGPSSLGGYQWLVTFRDWSGDVPPLTCSAQDVDMSVIESVRGRSLPLSGSFTIAVS